MHHQFARVACPRDDSYAACSQGYGWRPGPMPDRTRQNGARGRRRSARLPTFWRGRSVMKKRVGIALATALLGAGIVGGISFAGPQHDARCQSLHAQAQAWHNAANGVSDPELKARYNARGDRLEAK